MIIMKQVFHPTYVQTVGPGDVESRKMEHALTNGYELIIFYCSADGNYEVTLITKANVYYNGLVDWKPPSIYANFRSNRCLFYADCIIIIEFYLTKHSMISK